MSNQSDKLKEAAEALKFAKEMINKHFIIPGEELTDALEYIDSTLDALSKDTEQDREWVSCNERLPEPYQKCLVVRIDNTVHMDIYQMYHGGKCDFLYQVIHWMPLPTPPKV